MPICPKCGSVLTIRNVGSIDFDESVIDLLRTYSPQRQKEELDRIYQPDVLCMTCLEKKLKTSKNDYQDGDYLTSDEFRRGLGITDEEWEATPETPYRPPLNRAELEAILESGDKQ